MTRFSTIFKQKFSYLRPHLSITFPKGFRICKNIGHPTSESGGKKTFKWYFKSEQTDTQTDSQTDVQTDGRTNRLIESIGPEGRCFENAKACRVSLTKSILMDFCKQQLVKWAGLYFQLCKGITCYNLYKIRFIILVILVLVIPPISCRCSIYVPFLYKQLKLSNITT